MAFTVTVVRAVVAGRPAAFVAVSCKRWTDLDLAENTPAVSHTIDHDRPLSRDVDLSFHTGAVSSGARSPDLRPGGG
jgi:hypothetical protein